MNSIHRTLGGVKLVVASLLGALAMHTADASVVIMGTRVIYPSDARDVNIRLTNNGETPALVQAWVDNGDPTASPESTKVPFVLTPPLSRLDPSKNQTLRLVFTGLSQPKDKESIFWLNVLEIPPKPEDGTNYLQFAVRTRIKIFYRPSQLKGGPEEAVKTVTWGLKKDGQRMVATATNPSAFYVSMSQVQLFTGEKAIGKPMNVMVAPGGTESIPFPETDVPEGSVSSVHYQVIDDFGALIDGQRPISARP